MFDHAPGPAWSLEHARRRLLRRWLKTTAIALRPRHLWRDLRPDHPINPRRLLLLAAAWLLLIQLLTAALAGASRVWLGYQSPGIYGSAFDRLHDGWPFWLTLLKGLAWPFRLWVSIPVSVNSCIENPIGDFAIMALVPHAAMAAMLWLLVRPLREAGRGPAHLARALVLSFPSAAAWLLAIVGAFVATGILSGWYQLETLNYALAITLLAGLLAWLIWWWRCFVVEYLGHSRRQWLFIPLGLAAFAITWCVGAAAETLRRP